ncbi:hypothetical protein COCC4DRAFT_193841 [Bipolaris maydis ATCC 48331]|uniref:Uncharacterized protein n=2 Tax=Cochliobolus heterostrophus TaxID=5016 RepID=N4XMN8_COCH4|nr:uncharacterized protein COCC4DRAFT_193841 [Bipolaris maydis ATCC 48331]ENI06407.1 hypothetical protein COCC4DRAFT_193841 [Bipolaris maydis ATCC 48331]
MELVCPLTTSAVAPEASEMVVPDVTIEPPALSSIDPIRYAVAVPGNGLNVTSPIVRGGALTCEGAASISVDVTSFITTKEADDASDNVVPETVIAGPPGIRVLSATTNTGSEGFWRALNIWLPTVMAGGDQAAPVSACTVEDAPLTTNTLPEGSKESVVPEKVTAAPPGSNVCSDTTNVGAISGLT